MIDLDGIYAAAQDADAITGLADAIAHACGTRSAMYTRLDAAGRIMDGRMNYWPLDSWTRYYDEDLQGADPWLATAAMAGGRAIAVDAMLPPEHFVETALYREIMVPIGDDTALLGHGAARRARPADHRRASRRA